jgi:hypothetical protein
MSEPKGVPRQWQNYREKRESPFHGVGPSIVRHQPYIQKRRIAMIKGFKDVAVWLGAAILAGAALVGPVTADDAKPTQHSKQRHAKKEGLRQAERGELVHMPLQLW